MTDDLGSRVGDEERHNRTLTLRLQQAEVTILTLTERLNNLEND